MTESLRWTPEVPGNRPRLLAAMSYLGILCFVPLLFNRGDNFVAFHARQGLVIWTWGVLALFSLAIPGLHWVFAVSSAGVAMLSFLGVVSALLLQQWKFPVIGELAEKL